MQVFSKKLTTGAFLFRCFNKTCNFSLQCLNDLMLNIEYTAVCTPQGDLI